jgi:hypothetical protein
MYLIGDLVNHNDKVGQIIGIFELHDGTILYDVQTLNRVFTSVMNDDLTYVAEDTKIT